jgi:hypothetical protein
VIADGSDRTPSIISVNYITDGGISEKRMANGTDARRSLGSNDVVVVVVVKTIVHIHIIHDWANSNFVPIYWLSESRHS